MAAQQFNATPEQLAILVEYCRSQVQQYAYGIRAELQAAVEAISGPCFSEIDGDMYPVSSDGEAL